MVFGVGATFAGGGVMAPFAPAIACAYAAAAIRAPFVILGTPRSRTAWLAEFLTYGALNCAHEPSRNWSGPTDLFAALSLGQGVSDSVLTLRWADIIERRPDTKIVVVHRPKADVLASFRRAGLWHANLPVVIDRICDAMEELTGSVSDALHVPFGALSRRDVCGRVWAHCRGDTMPPERFEQYRDRMVLADAERHITDGLKNAKGILRLYPELMGVAA